MTIPDNTIIEKSGEESKTDDSTMSLIMTSLIESKKVLNPRQSQDIQKPVQDARPTSAAISIDDLGFGKNKQ